VLFRSRAGLKRFVYLANHVLAVWLLKWLLRQSQDGFTGFASADHFYAANIRGGRHTGVSWRFAFTLLSNAVLNITEYFAPRARRSIARRRAIAVCACMAACHFVESMSMRHVRDQGVQNVAPGTSATVLLICRAPEAQDLARGHGR
jgi:hypothetical protein